MHEQSPSAVRGNTVSAVEHAPRQYLRLAVGPETYATPIDTVREILEATRLTAVPQTPPFVRGVMNLRGAVVPVIDLNARCGGAPTELGRRTCIVIVEVTVPDDGSHHIVGMLVDAVYEVFDVGSEGLEPPPPLGTTIPAEGLRGMARVRGSFLAVLDLDRLLAPTTLADLIGERGLH